MRKSALFAAFALVSLTSTAALAESVAQPKKKKAPVSRVEPAATPDPAQPAVPPAPATAASPITPSSATPATASAKTLDRDFKTLPSFASKVPTQLTMPASIPAGEKVEGMYLELPEYARKQTNKASRYVQIFGSQAEAQARSTGQPSAYNVCFQTGSPSMDGDRELRWNGNLSPYTSIAPYPKSYGANGPNMNDMASVYPVMSQKVVDKSADRIELQTKVALVDATTLGARLVTDEKAEFVLVKQIPGRIRVYANRDTDQVNFLVRADKHPDERFSVSSMFVSQSFTSVSASEGCHMSFKLRAEKDKAATAIAHLEVLMDVKPVSGDESPRALDGVTRAVGLRGSEAKEARIRAMQIGFSTSWMSLDTAPVLSISHGWLGRERTQQM